jgi:AcrR family transcriptional regulator
MARWEPDAQGRLQQSAMELFAERGYASTTVEDIAARAGLTERTFFRYFADKREVLFSASKELETRIADAIAAAPKTTAPLDAVAEALEATAPLFEARRAHARKRQALVAAHAELQERELIKLASLAAAIADSLRQRGVAAPAVGLIAEMGIAIFRNAFERWLDDRDRQDLSIHLRAALAELRTAAGQTRRSARRPATAGVGRSPSAAATGRRRRRP